MPVTDDYIHASVESIWTSMLGLPIEVVADQGELPGPDPDRSGVSALIQISGDWNGSLMLTCLHDLASDLTRTMFAMEEEEPTSTDIQDAIGELTNMVGGSIKLVLPEPNQLSLPMVVHGQQYDLNVPGSRCTRSIDYICLGHRLHLRLFEVKQQS